MIHGLGSSIDLFVHPGEVMAADDAFSLRTTLGSCVAVTAWHPERRIGGMCHFMLPQRTRPSDKALDGRYASEALPLLFKELRQQGADYRACQIKMFGGGNMFDRTSRDQNHVAQRNIAYARKLISEYKLRISAENVGGVGYRNLVMDIEQGDVWVRHVRPSYDDLKAAR